MEYLTKDIFFIFLQNTGNNGQDKCEIGDTKDVTIHQTMKNAVNERKANGRRKLSIFVAFKFSTSFIRSTFLENKYNELIKNIINRQN